MTHDELLANIDHNLDNEVWLYNMSDALRAVVELHKPYKTYEGIGCHDCHKTYPCQTIQAIEKELNG